MKKIYLAILLFFCVGTTKVFATHIMGMDLSYTCTGNNNYTFTLNFYRDCGGINVAVKYLHLVSKSNNYNKLVKLTEVGSPQNISLVCPSDINKTTCNGGTITGTQKWVFTANVTLPYYAKDWVFYYDDYARNTSITNLVNPSSDGIRVVDSLDNSSGQCVNSPIFTTLPTPYVCNMIQTNYNHGGFDADGDSLSYQLVAPLDSFGNAVKYVSPYTYSNPLKLDTGSFRFSSQSGQMTFTPGATQITVTAVRVNAYDKNHKLIGYVTRDIEIIVLTCNDESPTESWYYNLAGCYASTSNVVTGCVGHNLSFDIHGTDANALDSVYMFTNLGTIIPAASFTTTPGLPNATSTISWTPTLADTGLHFFTVSVKNNFCPIFNEEVYTFGINITQGVHARGGKTICNGSSAQLEAFGGTNYTWSPTTGLSCSTCSNPIASPSLTTTYTVTGSTSPLVCQTSDIVVVTVDTFQTHVTPHTSAICIGKNVQLTASHTGTGFTWAPVTGLSCTTCTNPVATPTASTNYILTATDNNSCVSHDTAKVTVNLLPTVGATATKSLICFNSIDTLKASGASTYTWSPSTNLNSTTGVQVTAGPTATTTYTVTGTNSNSCVNTATIAVNVNSQILASISSKTNVSCFGNNTGSATASVSGGKTPYSYSWNTTPVQTGATAINLTAGTYTATVTDANNCSATATTVISQPTAALSASISTQTNILCFGNNTGSATVNVTGGTTSYSYSWNTTPVQTGATATNLTAGTYTVTITDANNCSTTATAIISQPQAALSASISAQTNVACFGDNSGSATVNVTGGTASYSYSWNTAPVQTGATATNLKAGTYIVTITDAHNCSTTATAIITQPQAALSASIAAQTNVACFGDNSGSATVNVTGGTTSYSYSWNTNPVQTGAIATNLAAGTYVVTITDAKNCSTTATAVISQPQAALSASISAQTNVACFGNNSGSATVNVKGGTTSYSYSWNTTPVQTGATATNLTAGTYTVIVTDAKNCSTSATVVISQPQAALSASISANSQIPVACFGNNTGAAWVAVNGGTAPYSYSWNSIPAQSTDTASNLAAGSYIVTVTDANNCSTTASVTITQPTAPLSASISANSQIPVSCFGNNNGSAWVAVNGGTAPYSYSWNTTPAQTTDTASNLAAGSYTITVTDANNCSTTASVTITQPQAALSASIASQTNVSCFGGAGSASVSVNGGTMPYSYSWNTTPVQNTDTASSLSAGTYTVTVTDAKGCTTTATAIISQPIGALSASVTSQSPVLCFGDNSGSATVTATAGTPPYTYSWNTVPVQTTATASNLSAGSYTVTVNDSVGCSTSSMVTIAQPQAALSASISANNQVAVSCFGNNNGSAWVSVNGGTAPYSYSWNTTPAQSTDTAANLAAGSYTVTVTDANNCSTTASVTITQPTAPLNASISANSQIPISCFGNNTGAAWVAVNGGTAPYSYSWNTTPVQNTDTAVNLAAGSYTVTVTDANNCSATATVTITQPQAALSASISANSQIPVSCFGNNTGSAWVAVNGGTAPYSYSWNTTPAQSTDTASNLAAGSYIVTVTDANNCSTTASVTITQPQAPLSASISANSQIPVSCFGNNTGSAWVAVNGGTAPYSYSWNTTPAQSTDTASNLAAGSYIVTVTDANNCSTTTSVTISQPQAPLSVSITSQNNVSCFGGNNGSATASATGGTTFAPVGEVHAYNYSWNTVPAQTNATATGLSAGTYTVTVTDSNGCTATATVTISQPLAALSASIASQVNVTCFGGAGSASVATAGGTTPYSYSWNTNPVQNTDTAINLSAGTYTVTVTDSNGCSTTSSATITQPIGALNASITSQVPASCFGESNGSATVTVSAGTAPYTYSWNTVPVQTSATASNLAAGTYMVTVMDSGNCITTASVTIAQPQAALNATITAQIPVSCFENNNGSATVSVNGGTVPYTYSWNTAPAQTGATASNLAAGTYTVIVTDSNNCTTSAAVTITQPQAALSANITAQIPVSCFGNATGSATASVSGGTTPYSYTWNTAPVQTGATASNLAAGTYSVTITDSNNCTTSATVEITQPKAALSVAVNSPTTSVCNGSPITLTTTVSGGTGSYSYSWTPGGSTIDSITVNPSATTTYSVAVTDSNGCSSNASTVVNVNQLPVITVGVNPLVICNGNTDTLRASGATSYTWSPAIGLNDTAGSLILANPSVNTTYTVIGTNGFGCSNSTTATVQVNQLPTVSLSGLNPNYCSNSTEVTLIGFPPAAPPQGMYSGNAVQNNGLTGLFNPDSAGVGGPYTVTYTFIDSNGCKNSANLPVTILPAPNVTITPANPDICLGNSTSLVATGGTSYTWSPATGLSCTACSSTIANPTTNTTYTVEVNNGSCSASGTVAIGVFSVSVNAGPDQHILYGSTAQLNATGSGVDQFVWTPGNTLNNDSISDPIASPTVTTTYIVTATDSLGCPATDTVVIYVSNPCESLMVPSGFTPDGAQNRYFHVMNVGGAELQDFKVFNRWGQMVYETSNINDRGWDGSFNGKPQPMGTYVYYTEILCQGQTVFIKGDVTLIR